MLNTTLTLAGVTHDVLRRHLFPGDGLEAAAVLICSKTPGPRDRLLVKEVILVPHTECTRQPDYLLWPGKYLEAAIERAEPSGATIILLHSHPGSHFFFSRLDDQSDQETIPCLQAAIEGPHGSAIMTPDGAILARLYDASLAAQPIALASVVSHDIKFFWSNSTGTSRRPLAFTSAMTEELSHLTAVVIGVSGTGSLVAEMLARLGFGTIYLIDFDKIEKKNLNRILNSTLEDAVSGRLKVEMFADAISRYRGNGVAVPITSSIEKRDAVIAAGQADVLFSCVDTLAARHMCDLVCAAFLIPVFDVGVVIPVNYDDDSPQITDVLGRIDYVQPGRSSLRDRGVYSSSSLREEYLRNASPELYKTELEAGYIHGVVEEAPSVITLNMRAASACVNEFIARAYPFRHEPNEQYARTIFSLAAAEEDCFSEDHFKGEENLLFARGAQEPLLNMPSLRRKKAC